MAVFKNFRRAYHLKFASKTVQQANWVEVCSNISSAAALCSSHFRRLRQSSSVIFQCLSGSASAEQAAAEGEKAAKGKVRTYVVQSGDSLVSISKKFYQTPSRWKDVLDANQNQLSNPDELKAGQTIIIP